MKQPKIVFVGHVVIDHNNVEQKSYQNWGSPPMFISKYFEATFGFNSTIIASYGSDFLKYADGVKLLPDQPNLEHSTIFENIYIHGRRTLYCHHGDASPPELSPEIKAVLDSADLFIFGPLTSVFSTKYVTEFMASVPKDCLKVILPQGYFRRIGRDDLVWPRDFDEAPELLPLFDAVVLSDEDHLHAEAEAQEWKRQSPSTQVIVTKNSEGADIVQENDFEHIPTEAVSLEDIVDPVGSGDVFTAAFAYQLWQNPDDVAAAVKAGNIAAHEKLLTRREF